MHNPHPLFEQYPGKYFPVRRKEGSIDQDLSSQGRQGVNQQPAGKVLPKPTCLQKLLHIQFARVLLPPSRGIGALVRFQI